MGFVYQDICWIVQKSPAQWGVGDLICRLGEFSLDKFCESGIINNVALIHMIFTALGFMILHLSR